MAYYNRTEIGFKDTTERVTVPNDPRGKLMYYLDCVCYVLKLDDDADISRLRRYQDYSRLDNSDINLLIRLAVLLSPEVLLDKCFFQSDALCGDMTNKFYDLETVRNNLLVAGNIAIGGRNRRVTKIMTFTMPWFRNNWETPLNTLRRRQNPTSVCVIL